MPFHTWSSRCRYSPSPMQDGNPFLLCLSSFGIWYYKCIRIAIHALRWECTPHAVPHFFLLTADKLLGLLPGIPSVLQSLINAQDRELSPSLKVLSWHHFKEWYANFRELEKLCHVHTFFSWHPNFTFHFFNNHI